jgi:hypothetical protein
MAIADLLVQYGLAVLFAWAVALRPTHFLLYAATGPLLWAGV